VKIISKYGHRTNRIILPNNRRAVLAYSVHRECPSNMYSDPIGDNNEFDGFDKNFTQQCRIKRLVNRLLFILKVTTARCMTNTAYPCRKSGEEAILNLDKFTASVADNKYFRNINQKFTKLGYSCELQKTASW